MDVGPSDFNQVLPDAIPVPRTRDDLDLSGAAAIPGDREVRALGRLCDHLLGGSQFLALHARASYGAMRARGRRLVQGRITVKLADRREVAAVFATRLMLDSRVVDLRMV
jgi:hypothetical protein